MFSQGPSLSDSLLILVPMVVSALLTALFCYIQAARKRRVSFWLASLAACLGPFLALFIANLFNHGLKVFTLSLWSADAGLVVVPVLLGSAAVLCFIPAAGVCLLFKAKENQE